MKFNKHGVALIPKEPNSSRRRGLQRIYNLYQRVLVDTTLVQNRTTLLATLDLMTGTNYNSLLGSKALPGVVLNIERLEILKNLLPR